MPKLFGNKSQEKRYYTFHLVVVNNVIPHYKFSLKYKQNTKLPFLSLFLFSFFFNDAFYGIYIKGIVCLQS